MHKIINTRHISVLLLDLHFRDDLSIHCKRLRNYVCYQILEKKVLLKRQFLLQFGELLQYLDDFSAIYILLFVEHFLVLFLYDNEVNISQLSHNFFLRLFLILIMVSQKHHHLICVRQLDGRRVDLANGTQFE